MRRDMRDGLEARAIIPVACGRKNDLARARSGHQMGNLDQRIRIIAGDARFVRFAIVEIALLADSQWITGSWLVREQSVAPRDARKAATAAMNVAFAGGARKDHQID